MKIVLQIIISIFLSSSLFAYIDSDMDGVEDAQDRCPNTPFSDLVDIRGCTKSSLVSAHHYDVIVGASFAQSDYQTLNTTDTLSTTLQVDYYYKNFSMQASTSYFSTEGNGFNDSGLFDSFVGASYQFRPLQDLSLRLGLGVLLPTYDNSLNNNNTDYTASLNLSYNIDKLNIFGGYAYTIINDDNVNIYDANTTLTSTVLYQNTHAYSLGLGYYMTQRLYTSLSYNASDSIYESVEDIQSMSTYMYYSIDSHWFLTFSYAYGLSDSASKNFTSLRLGYFF
ncbi:DUF3187 domain-containing protein [Sulfurimonas sp. SAG-AH-194-C21]|nr:DUF3187 domain-containing protein [Sulfurimonas sp. SAG-AH-194-C21]MDF1883177.1 DUF3187 domain-containing protein [Sulfurimonas sp. SAG-AH-194-C21]